MKPTSRGKPKILIIASGETPSINFESIFVIKFKVGDWINRSVILPPKTFDCQGVLVDLATNDKLFK